MNLEKLVKGYDFTARTIVVTGGTGVLGAEICCALVKCGADVVVLGRDRSKFDALKGRLAAGPSPVYGLINAAGGNAPQATTAPDRSFFDLPEEALRQVADLNLLGTILPSQVFGRMMAERGEGVILNISSMAAYRPLARTIAYSAAKAAVSNFTQWLAVHMAQEYSPRIRVNAIAPGFFHTRQNHFLLYDEKTGDLTPRGRSIIDHTPMRRFGNPEDLQGVVLWLLSPASEFVTGTVVAVDGGFSAFSGV